MAVSAMARLDMEPRRFVGIPVANTFVAHSIEGYRKGIRAAVRGLWMGVLDKEEFYVSMSAGIRRWLHRAWQRGAWEFGVRMDELSAEELKALQDAILYEHQWIVGFADEIVAQRDERLSDPTKPPRKWPTKALYARVEPWARRYEGVRSKARAMAAGDQKLKWDRGATKKPCRSCLVLDRKVKRASWWLNSGILPRVHDAWWLICKGFNCLCQLLPTSDPMSRGRMPKLP